MPVQIPTLKRLDVQAPESVGRIDVQAPDLSKGPTQAANQLAEIAGSVDNYIQYQQEIEQNLAHTKAVDAATEYEQWYNKRLDGDSQTQTPGLRHLKGDPTEAYNKFDEEDNLKRQELIERYKDAPMVQGYVKGVLAGKQNSLYKKRLTAYGNQYSTYEQKVTDDAVNLEIQNAGEAAQFIDAKNPSTLAPFESAQANISHLLIRNGLKNGTVTRAAEGEKGLAFIGDDGQTVYVKPNPSVMYEINKHRSKATYDAIDGLLKADQVESARMMMDKYKDYLDPVNKAKLDEQYEKVDVEQKAYGTLGKMQGKSFPEQVKEINKLPAQTPHDIKVKHKALELAHSNNTIQKLERENMSKDVYNDLAIMIQKRAEAGQPFRTLQELQSDNYFKGRIDLVIDEKQRRALTNLVEQPKKDDPETYANLMQMTTEGKLYGMSYAEFAEHKEGLSKSSAKMFDNYWKKANDPETPSAERAKRTFMGTQMTKQLESSGLLKRNSYGKYTNDSQLFLAEAQTRLNEAFENMPKDMGVKEQNEYLKQFVAAEVLRKQKESSGFFGFGADNSETPVPKYRRNNGAAPSKVVVPDAGEKAAPSPRSTEYRDLTPEERTKIREEFKAAHGGRRHNDAAELMTWYTSRKK